MWFFLFPTPPTAAARLRAALALVVVAAEVYQGDRKAEHPDEAHARSPYSAHGNACAEELVVHLFVPLLFFLHGVNVRNSVHVQTRVTVRVSALGVRLKHLRLRVLEQDERVVCIAARLAAILVKLSQNHALG